MNFSDYLYKEQVVDIELETRTGSPKFMARVEEIIDNTLAVAVIDEEIKPSDWKTGTKAILWGSRKGLKYSLYVEIEKITDSAIVYLKHLPARTHLRIDAFLVLDYKPVTEQQFLSLRKKYIQNISSESEDYLFAPSRYLSDEGEVKSGIPSELVSEIHSIHRKLDFIIKTIGQQGSGQNIFNREPREVNLSGSGVRFVSGKLFQPGDYLDIDLILPISSGIIIELIGRVVRSETSAPREAGDTEKRFDTAVQFAAINEDDREFIIRYVFKRQRELLRAEDRSA